MVISALRVATRLAPAADLELVHSVPSSHDTLPPRTVAAIVRPVRCSITGVPGTSGGWRGGGFGGGFGRSSYWAVVVAGARVLGQQQAVASISLDPIARTARNQRRSDDLADVALGRQRPLQAAYARASQPDVVIDFEVHYW